MMRRLMTVLLLVLFFQVASARADVRVLTSLEVLHTMVEILARGTGIHVANAVPPAYSMSGQDGYFRVHGQEFLLEAADVDAVVTVGSVWPGDSLFIWARRANIHVIDIDAARPLDGYGAGVPQVRVQDGYSPHVWRSPANLMRMAAITARDLSRLSPADADAISTNLTQLQGALFRLRSRYETAFSELDVLELAAVTRDYVALTSEFGLNVVFYDVRPEEKWTQEDVGRFAGKIKKSGIRAVVCAWEPGDMVSRSVKEGGARPVVLTRFVREQGSDPLDALLRWYDANLSRIVEALQH